MKRLWLVAPAAVLALLPVSSISAAKPGPGSTTGTARVFVPNPVQSTGKESLTDQKDSDSAVPTTAYYGVTLTNLDGSGFLRGDWANVVSETGNPAYSPTNTFNYTRSQDEFEQVMAYFWITEAQKYIQSLGFGSRFPAVNKESQDVRINQWGQDNSFETDHPKDEMRFGKGGVDDAEDAEVILHEYGHAIHDGSGFIFGSEEAGAISEGFGDYWAVDFSDVVAKRMGVPELTPLPCVMDWDATSYTSTVPHCLRRLDANLQYPADLDGEVHDDGRIWSHALWDIHQNVGNPQADTIILKAQIGFPGTTMTDLANRTIDTAVRLYGNGVATKVRAAFHARGIV
ncbi:MAG: zinc metalloprotease ZmpB [Gaiellaceae bacterium]|nr:zinc metalloprotease ZmpB [Gaiellaceae bacterium]